MPNRKKSFREIARQCNVSVSTVSRLANGIGSPSGEKTDLVRACLISEGYEIKAPSQKPRSKTVSLIVADLPNEIFNRIAITLSELLAEQNYTLSIYIDHNNSRDILDNCIQRKDSGVIFMGLTQNPIQMDSPIPVIHVMSSYKVTYRKELYCIFSDDYVGGQLVARKMLNQGRRHPLILNYRHSTANSNLRIEGFLEEFRKAGIDIPATDIHSADPRKSSYSDALDAVSYLWTKGVNYDSVFAASDWRAYGAVSALTAMNISVPGEVMVVGYDGSRISRYGTYPFPSVQQNPELIAATAVRPLLDMLDGRTPEQKLFFVPVQMSRTGG